jgi:hypothetical protein
MVLGKDERGGRKPISFLGYSELARAGIFESYENHESGGWSEVTRSNKLSGADSSKSGT